MPILFVFSTPLALDTQPGDSGGGHGWIEFVLHGSRFAGVAACPVQSGASRSQAVVWSELLLAMLRPGSPILLCGAGSVFKSRRMH